MRNLRPSHIRTLQTPLSKRPFITLPSAPSQTLQATRILPYPSPALYAIISDIDAYASFLPYCKSSKITSTSSAAPIPERDPEKEGTKQTTYPATADLTVGWGGVEETFTSKLLCAPPYTVEALAGAAESSLSASELSHYSKSHITSPPPENNVFNSLITRWSVKPFHYKPPPVSGRPQTNNATIPAIEQTQVSLHIEFAFKNPMYAAMSQAVAGKVTGVMIDAFEKRARELLEGPGREGR